MGQQYRQYTEEQKAAALAYLEATGGNQRKTARDCNLPLATLQKWMQGAGVNEAVTEKVVDKTLDLADLFENELRHALLYAGEKREQASYQQLITGAAISADKMRLLRDQTTANSETVIKINYAHSRTDPAEPTQGPVADHP
jgi:transposase-like protein